MKYMIILVTLVGFVGCNSSTTSNSGSQNSSNSNSTKSNSQNSSSAASVVYTHFAYVADNSTDIMEYNLDPTTGQMTEMVDSSLNRISTASGSSGIAESLCSIRKHPTANLLFALNCAANTVAPFTINSTTGVLSPVNPNLITNAISTTLSSSTIHSSEFAFDSTGSNLYVAALKNSNGGSIYDYLVKMSINTSTGAIAYVSTVVTNTSGNDLVGNYLTANSLVLSNATSGSYGIHTYQINNSTTCVDQYDNGSLSPYSNCPGITMTAIIAN